METRQVLTSGNLINWASNLKLSLGMHVVVANSEGEFMHIRMNSDGRDERLEMERTWLTALDEDRKTGQLHFPSDNNLLDQIQIVGMIQFIEKKAGIESAVIIQTATGDYWRSFNGMITIFNPATHIQELKRLMWIAEALTQP